MTQAQATAAADPVRQAAYRRLALTILALDVPTLAWKLQAARSTMPVQGELARAA